MWHYLQAMMCQQRSFRRLVRVGEVWLRWHCCSVQDAEDVILSNSSIKKSGRFRRRFPPLLLSNLISNNLVKITC
ncbi:hypothetical protein BDA96_10G154200 [Sorghum bicolor]|uniref:Uncharacterized protein n=1 Tax=Sorghum bicolor TaxID=4558 RepID=A0A921U0U0_SORBI|nr:hypothetical protein BDA96_10G154200 [Sorghum bicolor]